MSRVANVSAISNLEAGGLWRPGRIGPVEIANRIVRAGTSETAAGEGGEITDQLVAIYAELARNRVGLILSGHMFCHPRGRYASRQVGIHSDSMVAGLTRLTGAVHRHGGIIDDRRPGGQPAGEADWGRSGPVRGVGPLRAG